MNTIENYGSDEEHHSPPCDGEFQTTTAEISEEDRKKMTEEDVNYDNITMEMSEDSSHNDASSHKSDSSDTDSSSSSYNDDSDRRSDSRRKSSRHRSSDRSHSDSPDYHKGGRDYERRRRYYDDYHRDRDRDRDREDRRGHRYSRSPSYHRYDRSRKSRSRSPRDRGKHYRRDYHSPVRRRRDHYERSWSGNGSGGPGSGGTGGSGCDRKPSKLSILEKLGIELKLPETDKDGTPLTLPSYYNPVAMNPVKYAEQIAKRKLLWGNAQKQKATTTAATPGEREETNDNKTTSVWQGARFSQDQDGKLTAKFQRLMGIKKDSNGGADTSTSKPAPKEENNLLKKQEELFSSMELQYEVARQATHTQRGVGLGFGAHHFTK